MANVTPFPTLNKGKNMINNYTLQPHVDLYKARTTTQA